MNEPVFLPKEPSDAMLLAIAHTPDLPLNAITSSHACAGWPARVYRALYAHLTKPATKKRWGVSVGPQYGWVHFDDFEKAMQVAKIEAAAGKNPVTIEHREVPA